MGKVQGAWRPDLRIPDEKLAEVFDRGFTVVEGFLDHATLSAAQDALWDIYPTPQAYFANPAAYPQFADDQFAGLRFFPYPSWASFRVSLSRKPSTTVKPRSNTSAKFASGIRKSGLLAPSTLPVLPCLGRKPARALDH